MTPASALKAFQDSAIEAAEQSGAEMFLGVPDEWYEPEPNFGCQNGHVSRRYLITETGDRCLACHERVVIIPQGYTDDTLSAALKSIVENL